MKRRRNSSALTVIVRDPTAVGIVLPSKRDLVVGDVDDPMVRDGDAVCVSRQVVQDMGGPTEGRFGVDDPIMPKESSHEGAECLGLGQVA